MYSPDLFQLQRYKDQTVCVKTFAINFEQFDEAHWSLNRIEKSLGLTVAHRDIVLVLSLLFVNTKIVYLHAE